MANCLVTGGAGFIGSHLTEALLRRGDSVRVLDDLSTGRRENLAAFERDIELIIGDLRDPEVVARAVRGVDVVFHQGALPSVPRSIADPATVHDVNATGTLNVLLAARDAGVRRVVYASSSSVYGDSPTLPKREDMPIAPKSPYAASKLAGEQYCRAFAASYGMATVCLRYFNVFGPRQNPRSQYAAVVPRFIDALLDGARPVVFGDGRQSRDFTFVDNVVSANLRASLDASGTGVFNIACGQAYTLLDLLAELGRVLGVNPEPVWEPGRAGDVKHSLADIEAARRHLGYEPQVGFREGIARTAEWFRSARAGAQAGRPA